VDRHPDQAACDRSSDGSAIRRRHPGRCPLGEPLEAPGRIVAASRLIEQKQKTPMLRKIERAAVLRELPASFAPRPAALIRAGFSSRKLLRLQPNSLTSSIGTPGGPEQVWTTKSSAAGFSRLFPEAPCFMAKTKKTRMSGRYLIAVVVPPRFGSSCISKVDQRQTEIRCPETASTCRWNDAARWHVLADSCLSHPQDFLAYGNSRALPSPAMNGWILAGEPWQSRLKNTCTIQVSSISLLLSLPASCLHPLERLSNL
jgi:hypothetical protein